MTKEKKPVNQENTDPRSLTFGECMLGVDLRSPREDIVYAVKETFANMANMVVNVLEKPEDHLHAQMLNQALNQIMVAELVINKALLYPTVVTKMEEKE